MAVATIDGVRIPDAQMLALLLDAREQGFRLEASDGHGGHPARSGLVVYPPDPTHPPIHLGCTEVNRKHVANVRASLRRAGYRSNPEERTEMARSKPKTAAEARDAGRAAAFAAMEGMTDNERVEFAMAVSAQACEAAGLSEDASGLVGMFVATAQVWDATRPKAQSEDVAQALTLAEEAEHRAAAAERRAEAAERKGSETGRLLTEALQRAEAAEAEAKRLRAALDPLRALLTRESA